MSMWNSDENWGGGGVVAVVVKRITKVTCQTSGMFWIQIQTPNTPPPRHTHTPTHYTHSHKHTNTSMVMHFVQFYGNVCVMSFISLHTTISTISTVPYLRYHIYGTISTLSNYSGFHVCICPAHRVLVPGSAIFTSFPNLLQCSNYIRPYFSLK